ncbi:response regulator [Rhodopseudomonas sp. B29]|uniref:response regulator n=1 Tax=Rhodopseudomonas sp. B29 TaxID=95607 RepID=UPI000346F2E7|nr:response regulator [Rhodopseudomonas sp. B29]
MTDTQNARAGDLPGTDSALPRLLVIDDDAVHRAIICKIAIRAGFEPVEAATLSDVVELMTYNDFEGATVDLSLGEEAGTDVLRHFADRDFRSPIIILSGATAEVTRKAHDLGQTLDLTMLEAVGKPVDLAELRNQLSTIARTWRILQQGNAA